MVAGAYVPKGTTDGKALGHRQHARPESWNCPVEFKAKLGGKVVGTLKVSKSKWFGCHRETNTGVYSTGRSSAG